MLFSEYVRVIETLFVFSSVEKLITLGIACALPSAISYKIIQSFSDGIWVLSIISLFWTFLFLQGVEQNNGFSIVFFGIPTFVCGRCVYLRLLH